MLAVITTYVLSLTISVVLVTPSFIRTATTTPRSHGDGWVTSNMCGALEVVVTDLHTDSFSDKVDCHSTGAVLTVDSHSVTEQPPLETELIASWCEEEARKDASLHLLFPPFLPPPPPPTFLPLSGRRRGGGDGRRRHCQEQKVRKENLSRFFPSLFICVLTI